MKDTSTCSPCDECCLGNKTGEKWHVKSDDADDQRSVHWPEAESEDDQCVHEGQLPVTRPQWPVLLLPSPNAKSNDMQMEPN